jgi:hypothetical protein
MPAIEMRCDAETGDVYFLAPLTERQMQLVDEAEAQAFWMALRSDYDETLSPSDAHLSGTGATGFDLDFGADFARPRAN